MDTQGTPDNGTQRIQEFRIERGARVLGPDGALGTVEQVVVEPETGEVQSLVVRGEAGIDIELPADRIERATGNRVYLSIGRADLAEHPELAPPHKAELFAAVDEGAVVPPAEAAHLASESPILTEMSSDAVEMAAPSASAPDIADQPTVILPPDTMPVRSSARAAPPSPELEPKPIVTPTSPAAALAAEPDSSIPEAIPSPDMTAALAIPITPVAAPHPSGAGAQARPPAASRTAPRGPQGAGYREPGMGARFAPLTASLVLLGAAGVGIAYLAVRRRQRRRAARPLGLATVQKRVARMMSATSAAGQMAQARISRLDGSRAIERLRDVRLGSIVEARMRAMRDVASHRMADIGSAATLAAALGASAGARQAVWQRLRGASVLLGGMGDAARLSMGRVRHYGMLMGAAGRSALAAPSHIGRPTLRRRVRRTAVAATAQGTGGAAATSARVAATRRAAGRRARRARRRLRSFRRGLYVGAVCGILFAPEPGRTTREKIIAAFESMTRGQRVRPRAAARAQHVGGAGPHPRSPEEAAGVSFPGVESSFPPSQPTSEEPLVPPPSPDMLSGEIPGAPSVS